MQCCVSGIWDSVLFDPWIRDTGWKNPDLGSGIRDEHPRSQILYLGISFFGIKMLKFFDADPDQGYYQAWIRDEKKSRIRDPG